VRSGTEHDFPHTLGDAIVLSEATLRRGASAETLVHEKVHVLQRDPAWRRDIASRVLVLFGFHPAPLSASASSAISRAVGDRSFSNPDLDGRFYRRVRDDAVPIAVFRSDTPRDLLDTRIVWAQRRPPRASGRDERDERDEGGHGHPFEEMAYAIAKAIIAAPTALGASVSTDAAANDDSAAATAARACLERGYV